MKLQYFPSYFCEIGKYNTGGHATKDNIVDLEILYQLRCFAQSHKMESWSRFTETPFVDRAYRQLRVHLNPNTNFIEVLIEEKFDSATTVTQVGKLTYTTEREAIRWLLPKLDECKEHYGVNIDYDYSIRFWLEFKRKEIIEMLDLIRTSNNELLKAELTALDTRINARKNVDYHSGSKLLHEIFIKEAPNISSTICKFFDSEFTERLERMQKIIDLH